jgi:hypothetical protein
MGQEGISTFSTGFPQVFHRQMSLTVRLTFATMVSADTVWWMMVWQGAVAGWLETWECGVPLPKCGLILKKFSIIIPTIITPIFSITMAKG